MEEWSKEEEERTRYTSERIGGFLYGKGEDFYKAVFDEDVAEITLKDGEKLNVSKMHVERVNPADGTSRKINGMEFYVAEDEYGNINEENIAYERKSDAIHAMELYADSMNRSYENAEKEM